jgi:hypothetical protein
MVQEHFMGGCQCGAVRFAVSQLGRASLCHCRMCQKAFAGIGGLLVTARDLRWTRGEPRRFQSSNKVQRGFCGDCGTPLTFETKRSVDVAICAFDNPAAIQPTIQLPSEFRLPWADTLADLPLLPESERQAAAAHYAGIVSYQHPDHDTAAWPLPRAGDNNGT